MRKSKHFRKDVIIARIIAAGILVVFIVLIHFLVSVLVKPSVEKDKNSQYEQQDDWENDDFNSGYNRPQIWEFESSSEDTSAAEPEEMFIKTTAQVRVRLGPGTNYEAIGYFEKDVEVKLIEEVQGWYKILYEGKEGYISGDYAIKIQK